MQEESIKFSVDEESPFHKSLKELKELGSQLYHAADYCESTFLSAEDKKVVVETTKEYISQAVVAVVDHIGSVSDNLERCISKSNYVPETERKIDWLKQRLLTSQEYSHNLALGRLYWRTGFTRYHSRYICPPLTDSATKNAVYRDFESQIVTKSEKQIQFETEEPLFFYTYNCKPSLPKNSNEKIGEKDESSPPVLPVRDGWSVVPKTQYSVFQFQEAQKLKYRTLNKKIMQNKEISSLIRRGKRILA